MIGTDKTSRVFNHQRKKQITKSNFGERNIRPRKRLLSDNYLCKIQRIFTYISINFLNKRL
jgi:hypothetical protein